MEQKKPKKTKKVVLIVVAVFFVLGLIEYVRNPEKYSPKNETPTPAQVAETVAPQETEKPVEATPEPTEASATEKPQEEEESPEETGRVLVNGFYVVHGDLQSVITDGGANGKSLIIKNKIAPSYSNKATIDQNYYVIEDLVKNQDVSDFDEIQYLAVSDMADGSEGKVISFTVSRELMDIIAGGRLPANMLGDYVEELWVLPSLLN